LSLGVYNNNTTVMYTQYMIDFLIQQKNKKNKKHSEKSRIKLNNYLELL